MTTYEWDGGGDDTSWTDPANWVDDDAPGLQDRSTAYVCLPDDATVELAADDVALVQAIDTGPGASSGSPPAPASSSTARGSDLDHPRLSRDHRSVGGPGTIELTGLAGTGVFSSDEVLPVPSTLASDPCALFDDLPPAACTDEDGRLVDHFALNGTAGCGCSAATTW